MLKIFYGRENINKEKYIFESLKGDSLLLVPDQYTLQAERSAFFYTGRKGFMSDFEVVSITRLGRRILADTGCSPEVRNLISRYGRYMLLSKIMYENRDRFSAYAKQSRMTSFVEMMSDFISEMKQNDLTSDHLLRVIEEQSENSILRQKLSDIHMVFSEYQEEIKGKYTDTEDYISAVTEKIPKSGFLKDKEIWVYGFDSMTERNLLLMSSMMDVCRSLNVVLTGDLHNPGKSRRDIFKVTEDLALKLRRKAEEKGCNVTVEKIPDEYAVCAPCGIAHIEKNLFLYPAETSSDSTGVTVVNASDLYNEAESAAVHILELVRDRGARYRDISVICNDLDTRGSVIKRVFEEYGMDVFIDTKRSLSHNPAVKFISILVSSAVSGLRTNDIISLSKTGLLDISKSDTEELENYVLKYRIKGNMWKKPFLKGRFEYEKEELDRINETREAVISPFLIFRDIFNEEVCVSEKLRKIYGFLVDEGIRERLEDIADEQNVSSFYDIAGETSQAFNYIMTIFDQIAAVEGDEMLESDILAEMMRTGFESIEVGVLPPAADGLVCGTAQRIRNPGAKHVVVIGANEGVFPLRTKNDGLLNTMEKKLLIEPDDGRAQLALRQDIEMRREEKLAIYRNLTGMRESLYISFSNSDIDGSELTISPVCTQIKDMFPEMSEHRDINNRSDSSVQIQTEKSLLRHLAEHMHDGLLEKVTCDEEEGEMWRSAICWLDDNEPDEFAKLKEGLLYRVGYDNLKKDHIDRLYSGKNGELTVSPSGLERYSRCPFSFFMTNGLRLKERRVFEIGGREIGDVYHAVLMHFSLRLTDRNISADSADSLWMKIEREESDRICDEIIDTEIERYRDGLFRNGNEEDYRTERLRRICREACWMIVNNIRSGKVSSMLFEENFGKGKRLRPVAVSLDSEKVYIEGKIDRVDYSADDRVRVVDYKTGDDSFSTKEALEGWKLQLMIYLKAASEVSGERKKPSGVYYFTIKEPSVDISDQPASKIASKLESVISKTLRLDGITVENTDKPTKRKITPEAFAEFSGEVDKVIGSLCTRFAAGEITPQPKRHGSITACTYCIFKGVCRYE